MESVTENWYTNIGGIKMSISFSKNFTVLRKKNNITQEKMAEQCGVSRAAVAKWESGSSNPDLDMVDSIAGFFDITVDELLHGEIEDSGIRLDSDSVAVLSDKLDEMKNEILSEIKKRDNNTDAYILYSQFANSSVENVAFEEKVPIEAYTYWGCEEASKGNYAEALKYYEEAVIRGDINSVFIVMKIYEDIIDMYAYEERLGDILETRLIQAKKMQQYGKIIEAVLCTKQVL